LIVHSTKYDGSLHYRHSVQVVHEEPGLIVVYGSYGAPLESYRGAFPANHHTLEFYWSERYYNLNILWRGNWRARSHYVNIATPATWHDGAIRFVDLDLDVIWSAATNDIFVDDEDEFELHQTRYAYPPALIAQAQQTSHDVRTLMEQRAYPFDGSLYTWRPYGTV
jgi:hypothetical protein